METDVSMAIPERQNQTTSWHTSENMSPGQERQDKDSEQGEEMKC